VLSFIIPAHNEEALLARTLTTIHACARTIDEPYEVIVADDASTDRTAEIAREYGATVVGIHRRQISASRNAGAALAQGDKLIFVDADTMITPRVLRGALRALRSGAIGGGSLARFDDQVPLYGFILIRVIMPILQPLLQFTGGAFLFCTRAAFEEIGGFSEEVFCAEEVVMAEALKKRGRFVILRDHIITSGRKVRKYSMWELLSVGLRIAREGRSSIQRREGLEVWYGPR
jgi:glycosyltransferase involved in cell wall biosynthesis